ncbi:MAG TPA: PEGA domain-containing protein [Myxococcales bacterium]|nr:PEGA domain-containing protein [Myxococcales bacterium]
MARRAGVGVGAGLVVAAAVALGGDLPPLQVSVETEVYSVLIERIEIRPGTSTSSYPEVQSLARLKLGSVPGGARVTLNRELRGRTPLQIEDLPLGAHDLVVEDAAHAPFHRDLRVLAPAPGR